MRTSILRNASILTVLGSFLFAGAALAGTPQLDSGAAIDSSNAYGSSQEIHDIYTNKSIYGKVTAESTADIYGFTPDKDGQQTFSLLTRSSSKQGQPLLVVMDPTDATKAQNLGLPTPTDKYHAALLETASDTTYYERALFQKFNVTAKQTINLKKDTKYYLVVIEPYGQDATYAIKLGDTNSTWGVKDLIHNIPTWWKLQTNAYAGNNPFHLPAGFVGLAVLMLGLIVLAGVFVLEQAFAWLSFRYSTAGYLLVKVQPISRIATWLALWFTAVGMYLYYDRIGWVGIPFILALVFVLVVIAFLIYTIGFSRRMLGKLPVTEEEAVIPKNVRIRLISYFVVNLILLVGFITLFAIAIIA